MEPTTPTTRKFDTEPCSRCDGTGHYSYNMRDGSRCYGCGGSGRKLTAKGEAQRAALIAAQTVPTEQIQVGWKVWMASWGGGYSWQRVREIEYRDDDPNGNCWHFTTGSPEAPIRHHFRNATLRTNRGMTREQLEAMKLQVWTDAGLL